MKKIINRLHRVEGQIRGIADQIEQDTACEQVITQLLAAKGSLDGALQAYINEQLEYCIDADPARMQELLQVLLKHRT